MKDGVEATTYWVTLVDGVGQREVPCYDPRGKDLKEDAPLPEGWEVKTSKAGKLYLAAPRQSSGGGVRGTGPNPASLAAWRNTEAGAKYEQERMDRRTALMQAVQVWTERGERVEPNYYYTDLARDFYAWLRESVSAPRVGGAPATSGAPREPSGEVKTDSQSQRVGADTPSDEGGEQSHSPTHREAASPSSSTLDAIAAISVAANACHCGQPWGPNTTASGKHVCLAGHVERLG
jgi:hypothetical protein